METKLLSDEIANQVKEIFNQLKEPVEVLFFGQENNCETCLDTQKLTSEVTNLSTKIKYLARDLNKNKDLAEKYQVDKAPTLIVAGREDHRSLDYGIRIAGIPSGHEFSVLIQDILLVSNRDSGLSSQTRNYLKDLQKPVHLQVFVTPT